MIQRIQTVYLFLVALFSVVAMFSVNGYYTLDGETIASFTTFTFTGIGAAEGYQTWGPYCLGILLLLVVFLSILSIMLFRKRMRQLRLTLFSTLLLFGYVISYFVFAYFYQCNLEEVLKNADVTFHPTFIGILPFVCLLLNGLAIHGIRKDEALVRSLDRLR